jgi:uncharacterized protein (TIGR02246 family)
MSSTTNSAANFLGRVEETWSKNDGSALADLFTADGSLINPFGERADGRDAIAAMYSDYFAGMLAGTSTSFKLETVRPVGDGHAFVDAEQTIISPEGGALLVVHLAALLRRESDDWLIADGRPYTPAPMPA